ncbi:S-layer homology domain-containing protein [Paenibacillus eucommiae]|uniref:YVTN family beta-propeller protein n=1 Tax=Paenibacillus eucommiae TaxID=1355755 RepID=A0ABS4IU45_9BACL|nr:S-layer homology domain-containing protein [Paenibacillus eucommiae]MBP1991033.1 YVTN family beta-propeller protein [Paenibacillus eucommiae]
MIVRTKSLLRLRVVCMGLVLTLLAGGLMVDLRVGAAASSSNIVVERGPHAIAANPVTERIYVANADSDSVTVIEDTYGSSSAAIVATVAVGTTPYALAVNPVTNKIYVANVDSDDVTVIDGATNSTATVSTGKQPFAVAVNPVTNKIYIANIGSNDVTVIDGATNVTTTIPAGESPFAVAVNPVTNKIYIANVDSDNVTVVDGVSNTTMDVPTGAGPNALGVDQLTGSVYIANFFSNNVTVIDGATGATTTVSSGITPNAVEVNETTGKIYVANDSSNNVTVIDGSDYSTSTVSTGTAPGALAINSATNKIYVASYESNDVTEIDGADHTTSTIAAGTNPIALAVLPSLNKIYVANFNSDDTTIIEVENESGVTNADLSALAVSEGQLSPGFAPNRTGYTVHVEHAISNVTVTASTYDPNATLSVSGQVYGNSMTFPVSLQIGANVLPIVVQEAGGLASKTYTITIYRANAGNPESPPPYSPGGVDQIVTQPDSDDVTEGPNGVTMGGKAATVTSTKTAGGKTMLTAQLHAESLTKAFGKLKGKMMGSQTVMFTLTGTDAINKIGIPAKVLKAAAAVTPNAVLSIKTRNAAYDLPINLPALIAILGQLGEELEHATVYVTMETIIGDAAGQLAEQVKAAGASLMGEAIDFTLTVEAKDSSQSISDFGHTYVTRSIRISGAIDSSQATAITLDLHTGSMAFVPSIFTATAGGETTVSILRPGNSLYAVVQSRKSFADVREHWAKSDVDLLASKLIVNGMTETSFAPEHTVTRSEFISLIIRALGLQEDDGDLMPFSDIAPSDWFAGAVGAALQAQLISGFEDSTFRPHATITREQMAVIAAGALSFAGKSGDVVGKQHSLLASFEDKAEISAWARVPAAQVIQAGIMTGVTDSHFVPGHTATRAEAAVVVKRLLQTLGFINE